MTYDQFVKYALNFKKHSDSIDDGWNIQEYENQMVVFVLQFIIHLTWFHKKFEKKTKI